MKFAFMFYIILVTNGEVTSLQAIPTNSEKGCDRLEALVPVLAVSEYDQIYTYCRQSTVNPQATNSF
jgi:hypothetical protein